MLFKCKRQGNNGRTRSHSGSTVKHSFGSDSNIQPHLFALSVPSALSSAEQTSAETVFNIENAKPNSKAGSDLKSHFLKHSKKITTQSRTFQKIKTSKESRSCSISSDDEPQWDVGKLRSSKWFFSDQRNFKGRTASASTMLGSPPLDLRVFGSVPPTPSSESSRFKFFSGKPSGDFRSKSATLPNAANNFASLLEHINPEELEMRVNEDEWFPKVSTLNTIKPSVDCPCTSCLEKRWTGSSGSNYQFPAKNQQHWISTGNMRKGGLYYNSNAAEEELDVESLDILRMKSSQPLNPLEPSLLGCVYANLSAIKNVNSKIVKSFDESTYDSKSTSYFSSENANYEANKDFFSLPKNFMNTLTFLEIGNDGKEPNQNDLKKETLPEITANINCPCCGQGFDYKISGEVVKARLEQSCFVRSEPTTPIALLKNRVPLDISRMRNLRGNDQKFSGSLDALMSECSLDYLKPNQNVQKADRSGQSRENSTTDASEVSKSWSPREHLSELHLMYMVPPPQCHSSQMNLENRTYENEEYWRAKSQANNGGSYFSQVTRSDSIGTSSTTTRDSDVSRETSISSYEDQNILLKEESESETNLQEAAESTAKSSKTAPNFYLRPRPQDLTSNFPYVWLLPSTYESNDDLKWLAASKFGNANIKKIPLSRLPTVKENVTFLA